MTAYMGDLERNAVLRAYPQAETIEASGGDEALVKVGTKTFTAGIFGFHMPG